MKGVIHSFESFGTVDGPGIRFVVFMQGCPMRCKYCHNPDTWHMDSGTEVQAEDVVANALRYKNYFTGGGGITVSGGEPLLQIDFIIEVFTLAKQNGLHTALDTSGITFNAFDSACVEKHKKLLTVTDLVLLDIKHIDDKKHFELTGHGNQNTLCFAEFISKQGVPLWLRHVLVPGINDDVVSLKRLRTFIDRLQTLQKVEILPYHTMGEVKYQKLGIAYPLKGVQPPDEKSVQTAKEILCQK